jgi:hypothetical protein
MKDYLTNAEELRSILGIRDSTEYFDFKAYTDSEVGFSVKRVYPDNISYKPPKNNDGRPDIVALLHVYYSHPSEINHEISTNAVPIQIDIMPYSYCNHSYDFSNPECPTRESIDISNRTRKPIALREKYLYNHESNMLIRSYDGKKLRGRKVLDDLFQEHCDTVHFFKGMIMRLRVFTQETDFSFLSASIWTEPLRLHRSG